MQTWYNLKAAADKTPVLSIFDDIGAYGVSAKSFLNDLRTVTTDEVDVEINSPGGDVFAGLAIYNGLSEKMDRFAPDAVSIERVFAQSNRNTVLGTAQAAGLAMLAAAQRNIPVALHTPTEAKLAITGNGQAQKIQVERMVTRILNLTKMPTPADAADALALAICHALRPAGALQGGEREQHLTAAQRQWAEAAQNSTRRRINHDRGM